VIFYHDGKGHGFGNYVLNQNLSQEKAHEIGIDSDIRDYLSAALLLKERLQVDGLDEIDLLYTCAFGQEKVQKLIID
jgi:hypothetical protein